MQFRVFFKVKVQNWDIFWVAKISNIFLGCLKFLIYLLGVNGRCWVRAYVYGKKLSTPPPPRAQSVVQRSHVVDTCKMIEQRKPC